MFSREFLSSRTTIGNSVRLRPPGRRLAEAAAAGHDRGRLVTQTPEAGVRSVLRAALDPEVPGAGFYGPGQRWGLVGPPVRLSMPAAAADPVVGRRLWAVAEELTGVEFTLASPNRPAAGDVPVSGPAVAPKAEAAGEGA